MKNYLLVLLTFFLFSQISMNAVQIGATAIRMQIVRISLAHTTVLVTLGTKETDLTAQVIGNCSLNSVMHFYLVLAVKDELVSTGKTHFR